MFSPYRGVLARLNLVAGFVLANIVFIVSSFWAHDTVTKILLGWDAGVMLYLALSCVHMIGIDSITMRRRSIDHSEGRNTMLFVTVLAAVASIAALAAELLDAKGHGGNGFRLTLAAGTVMLSWLFVQIVFARYYAHLYYLIENLQGQLHGGLEFGDGGEPDYWDFVHFSIILGAAAQTADICFKSKKMRRMGTLHTLVAFGFNTAILATMINLAAGLF